MNNSSRSLLVFAVLVGGVLFFFLAQRPHSVCDSQIEVFKESQKGGLYTQTVNGKKRPAQFGMHIETCRAGNSPGACYELFAMVRRLLRDLDAAPNQCLPEMSEVEGLKPAIFDSIELMVQLAWGSQPPEPGLTKYGWLETSDLALFCHLKRRTIQIFGEETLEQLRLKVQVKLPGELNDEQDPVCPDCKKRKAANETLSQEEIWVRSLFSVRCDQY